MLFSDCLAFIGRSVELSFFIFNKLQITYYSVFCDNMIIINYILLSKIFFKHNIVICGIITDYISIVIVPQP